MSSLLPRLFQRSGQLSGSLKAESRRKRGFGGLTLRLEDGRIWEHRIWKPFKSIGTKCLAGQGRWRVSISRLRLVICRPTHPFFSPWYSKLLCFYMLPFHENVIIQSFRPLNGCRIKLTVSNKARLPMALPKFMQWGKS